MSTDSIIDILYVGGILADATDDIQVLSEIGKAPLGWGGEFTPRFCMDFPDCDIFPVSIAMYSEEVQYPFTWERITPLLHRARLVLILKSNVALIDTLRDLTKDMSTRFVGVARSSINTTLVDEFYPTVEALCERCVDPLYNENMRILAEGYKNNIPDIMERIR